MLLEKISEPSCKQIEESVKSKMIGMDARLSMLTNLNLKQIEPQPERRKSSDLLKIQEESNQRCLNEIKAIEQKPMPAIQQEKKEPSQVFSVIAQEAQSKESAPSPPKIQNSTEPLKSPFAVKVPKTSRDVKDPEIKFGFCDKSENSPKQIKFEPITKFSFANSANKGFTFPTLDQNDNKNLNVFSSQKIFQNVNQVSNEDRTNNFKKLNSPFTIPKASDKKPTQPVINWKPKTAPPSNLFGSSPAFRSHLKADLDSDTTSKI